MWPRSPTQHLAEIVDGIYEELNTKPPKNNGNGITVLDEYVGDGYGIETPRSRTAGKLLAATEGSFSIPPTPTKRWPV